MTSERIGRLFDKLPELKALNHKIQGLLTLQRALAEILPAPLASSTAAAPVDAGNNLVLFSDNGAVAAKLRQMAPRILVFLRQRGFEVTGIQVQVQVRIRHNLLPQKQISLSPEAGKAIAQLSERLAASPLKAALKRLSGREISPSNDDDQPLKRK